MRVDAFSELAVLLNIVANDFCWVDRINSLLCFVILFIIGVDGPTEDTQNEGILVDSRIG